MEPGPPPIKMQPMIKCDKNPVVSSISIFFSIFCVQQYMHTAIINNNIDDQWAGPPQFNFCQSIKINNLAEIKGFYLKVAASGPHLTFLKTQCNNQGVIYQMAQYQRPYAQMVRLYFWSTLILRKSPTFQGSRAM